MKRKTKDSLELGSNVIQLLMPQNRPLIMVDAIHSYTRDPTTLTSSRHISANERIFDGHFSNLHLWPGIFTLEGMGQSCQLLNSILSLQRLWEHEGGKPEEVIDALRNLELGFKLRAGLEPDTTDTLMKGISVIATRIGVSTSVDVKFLHPVFAGQRLDFDAKLTHEFDDNLRFEAEALVENRPVARGVLTASKALAFPTLDERVKGNLG
jgi:3-hydroxyacyl-[acyl-carrier-protein] dehydratase